MDIEAKERSEPNALIRSALRLLRLFLNLTVAIFFCLSFSKIKKKCRTFRARYQAGCRTGTSFISDTITHHFGLCNPQSQNLASVGIIGFGGLCFEVIYRLSHSSCLSNHDSGSVQLKTELTML